MLIFMNIISKKETFYNYIHLWYHLSINKNELFESQGISKHTGGNHYDAYKEDPEH